RGDQLPPPSPPAPPPPPPPSPEQFASSQAIASAQSAPAGVPLSGSNALKQSMHASMAASVAGSSKSSPVYGPPVQSLYSWQHASATQPATSGLLITTPESPIAASQRCSSQAIAASQRVPPPSRRPSRHSWLAAVAASSSSSDMLSRSYGPPVHALNAAQQLPARQAETGMLPELPMPESQYG